MRYRVLLVMNLTMSISKFVFRLRSAAQNLMCFTISIEKGNLFQHSVEIFFREKECVLDRRNDNSFLRTI
jgi:hypothetical protein